MFKKLSYFVCFIALLMVLLATSTDCIASPPPKTNAQEIQAETVRVWVKLRARQLPSQIEILVFPLDQDGPLLSFHDMQFNKRQAYTLSGLPASPSYLRVRSLRSNGKSSRWSSPIYFSMGNHSVSDYSPSPGPQQEKPTNATPSKCNAATVHMVLTLVNSARTSASLVPLQNSVQLAKAAQQHSNAMAAQQKLTHTNWLQEILESGFLGTSFAQNIASNYEDPNMLVNAWLQSATHRAAILNPDLLFSGVGCQRDQAGTTWWAQDFGG